MWKSSAEMLIMLRLAMFIEMLRSKFGVSYLGGR